MKYAVQIRFDGQWLYVMTSSGNYVKTFPDRAEADRAAEAWRTPGEPATNTRVVVYE